VKDQTKSDGPEAPGLLPVLAPEPARSAMSLEQARAALDGAEGGSRYWRSLEELAATDDFQELIHREFPRHAAEWDDSVSRRNFLQVSAAGLALAGLTGCTRQPEERIVPFVKMPEELIPGRPLFFATAATLGGYATGLLAESHMGRPTKVEGNPEHPASLGSTDAKAQATILGLYDPDRSSAVTHLGRLSTWETLIKDLAAPLAAQEALGGEGLRILSGASSSPTLAEQLGKLRERFPKARWVQYEAAGRQQVYAGTRLAFGEALEPRYDFKAAEVVLSLDSDVFCQGPAHVRYAKEFAAGRRVHETGNRMSRLYAVESTPTNSGTLADHRLPLRPSQIAAFVAALAAELGVAGGDRAALSHEEARRWVSALASDLQAHGGRSLVVPGDHLAPEVQALVHGINDALGNTGTTVTYSEPVLLEPVESLDGLKELVEEMNAGRVHLLFVLGANPVYDAPVDLGFAEAVQKVDLRVHLGLYEDETAELCQWHLPEAHFLEGWSDARAFDGTVSIIQPLVEPLYSGRTVHEILALLTGDGGLSAYELVSESWNRRGLDEAAWRKALHDGLIAGSALPAKAVTFRGGATPAPAAAGEGLELLFQPDPVLHDGRFANNGWLQEAPKPITRLTWDNALLIGPATVAKLGLGDGFRTGLPGFPKQLKGAAVEAARLLSATGKMVRLTVAERTLEVPLWVVPGQAEDTLVLHLGHGRRKAGRVGNGVGFDANAVRFSAGFWLAGGAQIELTGQTHKLASTQLHHNIPVESEEARKRHMVRQGELADFVANPQLIQEMGHAEMAKLSMYPGFEYNGYAWGMAIDLSSCLGCNACLVACQAENNIPVVGKEQVARGREMHWIRIDRYFEGEDLDNPQVHQQPVPCMQCEQAPCEVVCPVAATVHNEDGLNDMVYNRCVGTRYCSNNCPYKVRRFNFLRFNDIKDPVVAMGRNPDVTVRSRGVMEKCTYCVQRINSAKIDARVAGRTVREGEIQTACQQVCPTDAIVFGDINDPQAKVRRWKDTELNYALLEELGTRPRTTYLAKLRNPNPELEGS
jgi:molybdopterin-containing oxidoreductase family iron-sulfur binding subunit